MSSSSISKENLLSILINRGFTSPIPDQFVVETENILFEQFGLDKDNVCDTVLASINNSAKRFQDAVKPYYAKYQQLSPILTNGKHTVRTFRLQEHDFSEVCLYRYI